MLASEQLESDILQKHNELAGFIWPAAKKGQSSPDFADYVYEATVDVKDFFKHTSVLTPQRLKFRLVGPLGL